MIIIKLWGGLGNQFFQYAYGYQLAQRTHEPIILDISWFCKKPNKKNHVYRIPKILKYKIEYYSIIDYKCQPFRFKLMNMKIVNKIVRIPSFTLYHLGKIDYLKETRGIYSSKIESFYSHNCYLDGYWQCPKYFSNYRNQIKNLFQMKQPYSETVIKLKRLIDHTNAVAIHIRRTDYVINYKHRLMSKLSGVLDFSYYEKCIQVLISTQPKFFIFSDDPQWCEDKFSKLNLDYLIVSNEKFSDTDELYLMSQFKTMIIANSTFSWWGAYLNNNENCKIFTPNKGFGNTDILPKEWIVISY
ncbi:MAG: alpha-1,2-fucosyltransferase [Spirochaetia bacterium]|jgi:hypothetical protein|nr:alpha-1,2-fucosyltransferase [Spirochaetia bacterium]